MADVVEMESSESRDSSCESCDGRVSGCVSSSAFTIVANVLRAAEELGGEMGSAAVRALSTVYYDVMGPAQDNRRNRDSHELHKEALE